MRFHTSFVLTIAILAFTAVAFAQDAEQADESVSNFPAGAVSAPLFGGSSALASELERTNYLDAGISLLTTFDDNALNVSKNQQSDIAHNIAPNLALRQSRGRFNWDLNYFGGFTIHQRFSAYNQGLHNFGFAGTYRLAEHMDLSVSEHFLMSAGFFNQISNNSSESQPSNSTVQQPNQSVITPLSRQNSNTTTVLFNDQFSASSAIGGSGTFYRAYFKDVPAGSTLIDTNSEQAQAYYNRRISARNSLGVTYSFQRFTFSPVANDTTTQSVFANYSFQVRPNLVFSVFGGPQRINTTSQLVIPSVTGTRIAVLAIPISQKSWASASGASFSWNGQQTGVAASFTRSVNDGGGLLGAVTLTAAQASLRRQLTAKYSLGMGFNYGISDAVGSISAPYSSVDSASGDVSLSRQIKDRIGLTFGYSRLYQTQGNVGGVTPVINHNRAWISLGYQFSRPLGR